MSDLLRLNRSENSVYIRLFRFRDEAEVADLAQLGTDLHAAEFIVKNITLNFGGEGDLALEARDWRPLLEEIETREHLESVVISGIPTGMQHLPLFARIFQALQRSSTNIRSLSLRNADFSDSNIASPIVSYLDSVPNLTELTLFACSDGSETKNIAAALQRNSNIQFLCLDQCRDELTIPIFQKLAFSESTPCLTDLSFNPIGLSPTEGATDSVQQYLESSSATIEGFQLEQCYFYDDAAI